MSNHSFETLARNLSVSNLDDEAKAKYVEMVRNERRWRTDIIAFSEECLGVPLNSYQKVWLSRTTTPRAKWKDLFNDPIEDISGFLFGSNISAIGNQAGKTVGIAVKHIWFNKFKIGMKLTEKLINTAHYGTLNIQNFRLCWLAFNCFTNPLIDAVVLFS